MSTTVYDNTWVVKMDSGSELKEVEATMQSSRISAKVEATYFNWLTQSRCLRAFLLDSFHVSILHVWVPFWIRVRPFVTAWLCVSDSQDFDSCAWSVIRIVEKRFLHSACLWCCSVLSCTCTCDHTPYGMTPTRTDQRLHTSTGTRLARAWRDRPFKHWVRVQTSLEVHTDIANQTSRIKQIFGFSATVCQQSYLTVFEL